MCESLWVLADTALWRVEYASNQQSEDISRKWGYFVHAVRVYFKLRKRTEVNVGPHRDRETNVQYVCVCRSRSPTSCLSRMYQPCVSKITPEVYQNKFLENGSNPECASQLRGEKLKHTHTHFQKKKPFKRRHLKLWNTAADLFTREGFSPTKALCFERRRPSPSCWPAISC